MNAAQFYDHWYKVWRDLLIAVDLLKDEHLSFRPAESYMRNVGDILRHIINLEQGWIHFVIRRKLPAWPEIEDSSLTTVAAIRCPMPNCCWTVSDSKKGLREPAPSRQAPMDSTFTSPLPTMIRS